MITHLKIAGFFLTLISLITGCRALNPKPLDTASGRPEITINAAANTTIRQEISNRMLDKGYTLTEESNQKLVFEKEDFQGLGQKVAVGVLVGGEDNRDRVVFNFLPKNQTDLRIVVEDLSLHTTDRGDNRLTARRQFYPQWQAFLDGLNKDISSNSQSAQNKTSSQSTPATGMSKSRKKKHLKKVRATQ